MEDAQNFRGSKEPNYKVPRASVWRTLLAGFSRYYVKLNGAVPRLCQAMRDRAPRPYLSTLAQPDPFFSSAKKTACVTNNMTWLRRLIALYTHSPSPSKTIAG